jgi:hypothetical protein
VAESIGEGSNKAEKMIVDVENIIKKTNDLIVAMKRCGKPGHGF